MQGVFVYNDEQEKLAGESKKLHNGRVMNILKPSRFSPAGQSHQKYILQRHSDVYRALKIKSNDQLMESTPAARLNGYVAGYGTKEQLEKEWASFGIADDSIFRKVSGLCGRRS